MESSRTIRTVPRGVGLFISLVGFLGLWGNRGLISATSITVSRHLLWGTMWIWRAMTFLFWRLSRKTSEELRSVRDKHCDNCDSLETTEDGRRYCGSCGCPRTVYSELSTKNGREGHNCPLGIHPGSVRLARTPCSGSGCGGNRKKSPAADYTI